MTFGPISRRSFVAGSMASLVLPKPGPGQERERDIEGGLGGTGIVGVLAGFGSLILAGERVETNATTRFSNRFGSVTEDQLRVGDSLTIEAERLSDGTVQARRVEVTYPLVGLVTQVLNQGQRLLVNGVTVDLEDRVVDDLKGTRVAVSGLWRGTTVVASRISKAPSPNDLVSGTIVRGTVGGVPVRKSAVRLASAGQFATVIGQFDPSTGLMIAQKTEFDRFVGAAGTLRTLSVEGWLEPTNTLPGFRISGLGHSFAPNLKLDPFQDQRMLFAGRYTDRFASDIVYRLPNNLRRRTQLLIQLAG